ncbi:cytochrome P450 [Amylostereum chailletii]|nr:cytochrome P450 [Amylostereum chailletii]
MYLNEDAFTRLHFDNLAYLEAAIVVATVVIYVAPWALDFHGMRTYPGPWLAKFSDLWLAWSTFQGRRSEVVHDLHKKYGPIVRLAPNHVSISDPAALYAHGNRATKTEFYDAFVTVSPGLFTVRDRAAHARKRKIVSHVFAPKTVLEFEPHVQRERAAYTATTGTMPSYWRPLASCIPKINKGGKAQQSFAGIAVAAVAKRLSSPTYRADFLTKLLEAKDDSGAPLSPEELTGEALTLLAGGSATTAKCDSIPIATSYETVMQMFKEKQSSTLDQFDNIPAIKVQRERAAYTATTGTMPSYWRPLASCIPKINKGGKAQQSFAGIAVAAVAKRLSSPTYRADFLTKLLEAKDDSGAPLSPEELTGGSVNAPRWWERNHGEVTLIAITYYLASNPRCQMILQKELDEALASEDALVCPHAAVKGLRYLDAVINESMRIHSLVGMGLPREVPDGGMVVLGKFFPAGSVLSVPSYSVHRNASVWGEDVDVFRPERWLEDNSTRAKAFYPFSFGPRACVGRNLVTMEMPIFIASLFRRYEFVLEKPDAKLNLVEGVNREVVECSIGIKRRHFRSSVGLLSIKDICLEWRSAILQRQYATVLKANSRARVGCGRADSVPRMYFVSL